jgi:hypothetical protein
VKRQRNGRWSWRATFALRTPFSICAEIAQASHFPTANLCREKIIFLSDCAQDGAIHSNKSAIIWSDTWGFPAGKHLPVDTVARGNKLQATADAA